MLDCHSLGVVLLELIAGTDVVLAFEDFKDLEELVTECEDYIDKETCDLLHGLIRESKEKELQKYLDEVLDKKPELVAEGIRGVDWAVRNVRYFQNKVKHVMRELEDDPVSCKQAWGLEKWHIDRANPDFKKKFDPYPEDISEDYSGYNGKFAISFTSQPPLPGVDPYWQRRRSGPF